MNQIAEVAITLAEVCIYKPSYQLATFESTRGGKKRKTWWFSAFILPLRFHVFCRIFSTWGFLTIQRQEMLILVDRLDLLSILSVRLYWLVLMGRLKASDGSAARLFNSLYMWCVWRNSLARAAEIRVCLVWDTGWSFLFLCVIFIFIFWCSLQAPTPAQSRSVNEQNMTEFATGLLIGKTTSVGWNQTVCRVLKMLVISDLWLGYLGATEGDEASRRRKERYRLELLQQIAEKQKNKRKWETSSIWYANCRYLN